jgi:hypothetical protein
MREAELQELTQPSQPVSQPGLLCLWILCSRLSQITLEAPSDFLDPPNGGRSQMLLSVPQFRATRLSRVEKAKEK